MRLGRNLVENVVHYENYVNASTVLDIFSKGTKENSDEVLRTVYRIAGEYKRRIYRFKNCLKRKRSYLREEPRCSRGYS